MSENRLELTKEQFDKFIRLPAIAGQYGYYKQSDKEIAANKHLSDHYDNWCKFFGIEFVVPRE